MKAFLKGSEGMLCPLGPKVTSFGREGCDIIIQVPGIEAQHAIIEYNDQEECWMIQDLNTAQGTYVNDCRIQNATVRLQSGDIIRFGYNGKAYEFQQEGPNAVHTCPSRVWTRTITVIDQHQHQQQQHTNNLPSVSTLAAAPSSVTLAGGANQNFLPRPPVQTRPQSAGAAGARQGPCDMRLVKVTSRPVVGPLPRSARGSGSYQVQPSICHCCPVQILQEKDSMISKMTREIGVLKKQLCDRDVQITNLRNTKASGLKELNGLRQKLKTSESKISEQGVLISSLREELHKAKQMLFQEKDVHQRMLSEINTAKSQFMDMQRMEREVRVDLELVTKRLEKFRNRVIQTTYSTPGIKAPESEISDDKLIETMKKLIDERTSLTSKIKELKEEVRLAQSNASKISEQQNRISSLREELDKTKQTLFQEKDVHQRLQTEIDTAKSQLLDMQRTEGGVRVEMEQVTKRLERFRIRMIQTTFSTPGIKAPESEITDDELIEMMKKLIDERMSLTSENKELTERVRLAKSSSNELLHHGNKLNERLTQSVKWLKDRGRLSHLLKQEVTVMQSVSTDDSLQWIRDLLVQVLTDELTWETEIEEALEKCGINVKLTNDAPGRHINLLYTKWESAIAEKERLSSQLTELEEHHKSDLKLQLEIQKKEMENKLIDAVEQAKMEGEKKLTHATDQITATETEKRKTLLEAERKKLRELEVSLETMREKFKTSEGKISEQHDLNSSLREELDRTKQTLFKEKDVLQRLQTEIDTAKSQFLDLQRTERGVRVDMEQVTKRLERFRMRVIQTTFSTPGFRAPEAEVADDELIEMMKKLIDERTNEIKELKEQVRLVQSSSSELLSHGNKLNEKLTHSLERLKDKGRLSRQLKQEVTVMQSMSTNDSLQWIRDLFVQVLTDEQTWEMEIEEALKQCGINVKLTNDAPGAHINLLFAKLESAIAEKERLSSQLTELKEHHKSDLELQLTELEEHHKSNLKLQLRELEEHHKSDLELQLTELKEHHKSDLELQLTELKEHHKSDLKLQLEILQKEMENKLVDAVEKAKLEGEEKLTHAIDEISAVEREKRESSLEIERKKLKEIEVSLEMMREKFMTSESKISEQHDLISSLREELDKTTQTLFQEKDVHQRLQTEIDTAKSQFLDLQRTERGVRVDMEQVTKRLERFRIRVIQTTFSTPGIKAPESEITDDELIEMMKKLIDEKTNEIKELKEQVRLVQLNSSELLSHGNKLNEKLTKSVKRLKDRGRLSHQLKQEVTVMQSVSTDDSLQWIRDLLVQVLTDELTWEMEIEESLEKCGVNIQQTNDAPGAHINLLFTKLESAIAEKEHLSSQLTELEEHHKSDLMVQRMELEEHHKSDLKLQLTELEEHHKSNLKQQLTELEEHHKSDLKVQQMELEEHHKSDLKVQLTELEEHHKSNLKQQLTELEEHHKSDLKVQQMELEEHHKSDLKVQLTELEEHDKSNLKQQLTELEEHHKSDLKVQLTELEEHHKSNLKQQLTELEEHHKSDLKVQLTELEEHHKSDLKVQLTELEEHHKSNLTLQLQIQEKEMEKKLIDAVEQAKLEGEEKLTHAIDEISAVEREKRESSLEIERKKLKELEASLETMRESLKSRGEEEKGKLEKAARALERLATYQALESQLREELAKLKQENSNIVARLESVKEETAKKFEEENLSYKEQIKQHSVTICRLEERVVKVTKEKMDYQDEVGQLKIALSRQKHKVTDQKVITQESTDELAAMEHVLSVLRRENFDIKKQLHESEDVIIELRRNLHITKELGESQKHKILVKELTDTRQQLVKLTQIVDKQKEEVKKVETEFRKEQLISSKLQARFEERTEQLIDLEVRLSEEKEEHRRQLDLIKHKIRIAPALPARGSRCCCECHTMGRPEVLTEVRQPIMILEENGLPLPTENQALQQFQTFCWEQGVPIPRPSSRRKAEVPKTQSQRRADRERFRRDLVDRDRRMYRMKPILGIEEPVDVDVKLSTD